MLMQANIYPECLQWLPKQYSPSQECPGIATTIALISGQVSDAFGLWVPIPCTVYWNEVVPGFHLLAERIQAQGAAGRALCQGAQEAAAGWGFPEPPRADRKLCSSAGAAQLPALLSLNMTAISFVCTPEPREPQRKMCSFSGSAWQRTCLASGLPVETRELNILPATAQMASR